MVPVAHDALPEPVLGLLAATHAQWPSVNVSAVSEFAALTRRLATAIEDTHDDAARAIGGIADGYRSVASEQMTAGWNQLAGPRAADITDGCHRLADALHNAAGYIAERKEAAVGELTGLADAYAAGQAADLAAGGLAGLAVPAVIAADWAVQTLTRRIAEYVASHVADATLTPLISTVADAIKGLDWSRAASAGARSRGFELYREAVEAHAAALRRHAGFLRAHVAAFQAGIRALEFEVPASSEANIFRSLADDASEALGALGHRLSEFVDTAATNVLQSVAALDKAERDNISLFESIIERLRLGQAGLDLRSPDVPAADARHAGLVEAATFRVGADVLAPWDSARLKVAHQLYARLKEIEPTAPELLKGAWHELDRQGPAAVEKTATCIIEVLDRTLRAAAPAKEVRAWHATSNRPRSEWGNQDPVKGAPPHALRVKFLGRKLGGKRKLLDVQFENLAALLPTMRSRIEAAKHAAQGDLTDMRNLLLSTEYLLMQLFLSEDRGVSDEG